MRTFRKSLGEWAFILGTGAVLTLAVGCGPSSKPDSAYPAVAKEPVAKAESKSTAESVPVSANSVDVRNMKFLSVEKFQREAEVRKKYEDYVFSKGFVFDWTKTYAEERMVGLGLSPEIESEKKLGSELVSFMISHGEGMLLQLKALQSETIYAIGSDSVLSLVYGFPGDVKRRSIEARYIRDAMAEIDRISGGKVATYSEEDLRKFVQESGHSPIRWFKERYPSF